MRALITGSTGFVAPYAAQGLRDHFPGIEVFGTSLGQTAPAYPLQGYFPIDLQNRAELSRVIRQIRPDFLVHLAAQSSVHESWKTPVESFNNNTNIFLNLVEAMRLERPACRILSVGSSEEYGRQDPSANPLTEALAPRPTSPYAVARVAQEHLSQVYVEGLGLDIICTRSFNHCGPGQSERFVVSALVKRFVAMERSGERFLTVGNQSVRRDFTDVRDVAKAYAALLEKGEKGGVYNVCTGVSRSIGEIIALLSGATGLRPELRPDPALYRPGDTPVIFGSREKITAATGWRPEIAFETTVEEMLAWWRAHLP